MTERKTFKKLLSALFSLVLIAAVALSVTSCGKVGTASDLSSQRADFSSAETLGEGRLSFSLKVTYKDGSEELFTVNTDEKTVGEALQKLGIIEGDEGDYGLFIKKVNGIAADFDVDKTYWAFYVDGKYAQSGIDQTEIDENAVYELRVEK